VNVCFLGETNLSWLQEKEICLNGIPSHDTCERFFCFVNANAFEKSFISWTQEIAKIVGGFITLDGKTICNSGSKNEKAIHLVSSFFVENSIVFMSASY